MEDLGLDGRKILKYIFSSDGKGVDWINLAQDRNRWRAVVKMEMNVGVE